MRSMFSAVSGLKAHQTRMDVSGNNISNVNTAGYKSQRVTFSDVFSQTISSATSASDDTGRGGINAMQVGLGVNVASIDMLMTQGSSQRTDNPFDVMVTGSGFLVVGDSTGQYFTRNGALRLDDSGNLVIPNGMKVQGWPAVYDQTSDKYQIVSQEVQPINLFTEDIKSTKPTVTTKAEISGNLCSSSTQYETSVAFYDSQGNYYTMALVFEKKRNDSGEPIPNQWTLKPKNVDAAGNKVIVSDANGNQVKLDGTKVKFGTTAVMASGAVTGMDITFYGNGKLKTPAAASFDLDLSEAGGESGPTGTNLSKIAVSLKGLTQFATKNTASGKATNGNSAGTLSGYSIGQNGIITASYSNGAKRDVAQVAIAEFDNAAGLEKAGENLYKATANSGEFDGIGKAGTFMTGVLEMSNVDLSAEFTDMIVTQRGFQANARIITVSDEMLQELTNLKR